MVPVNFRASFPCFRTHLAFPNDSEEHGIFFAHTSVAPSVTAQKINKKHGTRIRARNARKPAYAESKAGTKFTQPEKKKNASGCKNTRKNRKNTVQVAMTQPTKKGMHQTPGNRSTSKEMIARWRRQPLQPRHNGLLTVSSLWLHGCM